MGTLVFSYELNTFICFYFMSVCSVLHWGTMSLCDNKIHKNCYRSVYKQKRCIHVLFCGAKNILTAKKKMMKDDSGRFYWLEFSVTWRLLRYHIWCAAGCFVLYKKLAMLISEEKQELAVLYSARDQKLAVSLFAPGILDLGYKLHCYSLVVQYQRCLVCLQILIADL